MRENAKRTMVTRKADYAIRSLVYLCRQPENRVASIREISSKMKIPSNFLSKLFQRLIKKRIVVSVRGIGGGMRLLAEKKKTSLMEVLKIIGEFPVMSKCVTKKDVCFLQTDCMTNNFLARMQGNIEKELKKTTIEELSRHGLVPAKQEKKLH